MDGAGGGSAVLHEAVEARFEVRVAHSLRVGAGLGHLCATSFSRSLPFRAA